ncbi:hypothetical protein A2U01_0082060, partial [Trifolium medium]|nr:hypothetical protein [Trifolium medium]
MLLVRRESSLSLAESRRVSPSLAKIRERFCLVSPEARQLSL